MDINNVINIQELDVTPQDRDNTYLGIDENGKLIRTKIELSGGEAFKNLIERNVYPSKVIGYDGFTTEYELTEEQRAYNIETYEMSDGDNNPILIYNGMIFQMSSGHWDSSGQGEVAFSQVVGDVNLLDEIGVVQLLYNQDGDVEFSVKIYNVGSNAEVDLDNYYTKQEVDEIVDSIDVPAVDLDDYYTKNEIDDKLDELVIGGTDIDLTNYYTKQEVDDIVDEIDLTPFVTEDELELRLENIDVDLTGYATEQWVKQQGYATKTEVDSMAGDINYILMNI